VLALNGMLDLQVWYEQNLPEIEKALRAAGADVTVRAYPGLNHLFQPATTGSVAEYSAIETTFDEAVLRDIVEWIKQKTAKVPGAGDRQ
jgi:acetyl esterase/lipase